jgi:probable FeS assembly SUF system protein SufT
MHQEIALKREIEAIQIPSGDTIALPAGTKVIVTQSLGGTFTVATEHGLARISAANADALGLEDDAEKPAGDSAPLQGDALEAAVWKQLKGVYDPEIPVNIVDLGLVYDCVITGAEAEPKTVEVKMTLTAPGCGMGPTIAADAQSKIMSLTGIREARVELVWDPVWNREMISEEGKMKLGLI